MKEKLIRVKAICLFSYNGSILVAKGYDPKKDEFFYRPIGGGVEFGEEGRVAIEREVQEEIGALIEDITYVGTIENIFTFNGTIGHELVQVFDARFIDKSFYEKASFEGVESNGEVFTLLWITIDEAKSKTFNVVPEGILNVIE
ncbi:NUDIX domain-containing protein [Alteribacter aurantiacus]|uniref:NUDIX domain-containing protein n=1 Tax=Alteribacter aurantiacus TaxID=254410 RepID=UPI00041C6F9E|nr:NUDIX domain-containing protein [Alteribacter aurantiacus]